MDASTFTRFEECISSMGTWFEEHISSMGTHVLKEGRLLEALGGDQSDGGGRWKGQWWWEAIVIDKEVMRTRDLIKKI